ncbi:aldolase, partial [Spongiactinospora gelatinilytica]
ALVAHSLSHGYYQGGDTHPAHLVSRYVATYTFHLAHRPAYTAKAAAPADPALTSLSSSTALARARHALGD